MNTRVYLKYFANDCSKHGCGASTRLELLFQVGLGITCYTE